jgi:hypothetical protein
MSVTSVSTNDVAIQLGSTQQVTPITQAAASVQAAADPQTWIETVKAGKRGAAITVVFDNQTNFAYTTFTNKSFQLQVLYSLTG